MYWKYRLLFGGVHNMKKLFALLLVTLMLVSILPAMVMAVEDGQVEAVAAVTSATVSPREVVSESTIDGCVERLKKEFPDIAPERLRDKCASLREAPKPVPIRVDVNDAIVNARELYQERLQNMEESNREKMLELQERHRERLLKLEDQYMKRVVKLREDQMEKLARLDRARLKQYEDLSEEDLANKLDRIKIMKVKREDAFRKRVVAKNKIQQAEEKYRGALRNYNQAKKLFEEQKHSWEDAVKDGDETAAIEHAKAYLGHAADMVVDSLEKVRARIDGNDDMTDEEVVEALAAIDEKIAAMEDAKVELDAAMTKEEVKEAGRKILDAWERTRNRLNIYAEKVVRTQVGEILSRSEALENHLDSILAEMESAGVAVDDLDEKVDEFSDLIASARDKFAESKEFFEQAKEDDNRSALGESKSLAREAHDELKGAHTLLMEIVREVKQEGYDVEDDGEYVEVIEEDDDVVCCMAVNADCLACSAGEEVEDYCEDNPEVVGCEVYNAEYNDSDDNETEADNNATTME